MSYSSIISNPPGARNMLTTRDTYTLARRAYRAALAAATQE